MILISTSLIGRTGVYNAYVDTADMIIKDPPKHLFKTAPFSLLISQIPITAEARLLYEGVHSPKYTSMFGLSYNYVSPLFSDSIESWKQSVSIEDLRIDGFRIQGAMKYYILNVLPAPYGFYIGLHASYNTVKIYFPRGSSNRKIYQNYYEKIIFMNTSVIGGAQVIFSKMIAVDVYAGIGYRDNTQITNDPISGISSSPINMQEYAPIGNNLKLSFSINVGISL